MVIIGLKMANSKVYTLVNFHDGDTRVNLCILCKAIPVELVGVIAKYLELTTLHIHKPMITREICQKIDRKILSFKRLPEGGIRSYVSKILSISFSDQVHSHNAVWYIESVGLDNYTNSNSNEKDIIFTASFRLMMMELAKRDLCHLEESDAVRLNDVDYTERLLQLISIMYNYLNDDKIFEFVKEGLERCHLLYLRAIRNLRDLGMLNN